MKEFVTDLMHFGYLNKNDRIYEISNVDLKNIGYGYNMLYGEMGFPDRFEVSLPNVSHMITDFKIENNVLYGKVKILDTQKGKILQELVNNNLIVFRPRGSGNVHKDGSISNYKLCTFDAVDKNLDPFYNKMILRRMKITKLFDNIKNK